ncbi:MAG: PadR family transcriptional regulator [bacterium]|nr:PadR family transcriptional regulator [bacterium]
MAQKNISQYVILGLLTCRPMSGYDIKKVVETTITEFWHESYGNIYTTLKKLLDNGHVEKSVEAQSGKPDRHKYSITSTGLDMLTGWVREPCDIPRIRDEFLVKFFFRHHLPLEDDLKVLDDFRQDLQEKLEAVLKIETRIGAELKDSFDREHVITYLTFVHGKNVLEAKLKWCDEAENTLKKIAK